MKRFLAAAVLALLIAGASTQQASAWCKFNVGCGFNLSFEKGGDSCTTFSYSKTKHDGCPGGQCAGGGGPAYYGMEMAAPAHAYAAPATQAAPATPAQPTFPPAPKPADSTSGYQPASYWNYNQSAGYNSPSTGYQFYPQSGYGYGNAPSYWYGR